MLLLHTITPYSEAEFQEKEALSFKTQLLDPFLQTCGDLGPCFSLSASSQTSSNTKPLLLVKRVSFANQMPRCLLPM